MIGKLFKKLFGHSGQSESVSPESHSHVEEETESQNHQSDLDVEYPDSHGVCKLKTEETPKQVLSKDFPKAQWPISGGWGYTQDDAVILEVGNTWEGVALESVFLKCRSCEEAVIFMPKESRLAGLRFEKGDQFLIHGKDGRRYDKVTMKVQAFTEQDFFLLKNDFDSHDGYKDDSEDLKKHVELAESKMIRYEVVGWFDISMFFGKGTSY